MVKRAGAAAKLGIKVHAHMLRHACGFKLANDGIDTPVAAGVPRAQQYPEYDLLYGAGVGTV
jgi:integrase